MVFQRYRCEIDDFGTIPGNYSGDVDNTRAINSCLLGDKFRSESFSVFRKFFKSYRIFFYEIAIIFSIFD